MTGGMSNNLVKIELTNEEAEEFKSFRQYKQEFLEASKSWKQVHEFASKMQFGTFSLMIKDGVPIQIHNPLQTLLVIKI